MKKFIIIIFTSILALSWASSNAFAQGFPLPNPSLPTDWDSTCPFAGNGICYNNYVYLTNPASSIIMLFRLWCDPATTPIQVAGLNNLTWDGTNIGPESGQGLGCNWHYFYTYDKATGTWTGRGSGGIWLNQNYSIGVQWYSNTQFTLNFTHDFGSLYGNLGQVYEGDTLSAEGTLIGRTTPNPTTCQPLDIICQVKQLLIYLFIPDSTTLSTEISTFNNLLNGKIPFGYIAPLSQLDLSVVGTSTATATLTLPINITIKGHEYINTSMSSNQDYGIIALIRNAINIIFGLSIVIYVLYLVRRVF